MTRPLRWRGQANRRAVLRAAIGWGALVLSAARVREALGGPVPPTNGVATGTAGSVKPASDAVADAGRTGRELIGDPHFQRGLHVCRPTPGRHDRYGVLAGFESGSPAWDLVQWSSRESLAVQPSTDDGSRRTWANACKAVSLGRGPRAGSDTELVLAVNGWEEYGERARRDGEPWVHLLVEQAFSDPPTMSALESVRFRIAVRLIRSRLRRTPEYSTDRHAAQFQVFLTLQNQNRASGGFGRFLWFGIPLYDDRHRFPRAHKTQDTAGSGMFIFTPAGETFSRASAQDGDWVSVNSELLPLMREALETAWRQGYLTESRRLEDYRITGMNLGWEVPGILDVSMSVRDLSLMVVPRSA